MKWPQIDPKPIKNTKRHTNRSFHGFFNFCHGQVRKIQLRKVAKIYRRLYGGGQVCAPTIQTSVKFRDFEKVYPR